MRTIAIEEHFLAKGFREVMRSNASRQRGSVQPMPLMTAERQAKLADLDSLRLERLYNSLCKWSEPEQFDNVLVHS